MANPKRIPIPWTQRWQRLRHRVLPLLIFAGCVACTGWLWRQHVAAPTLVGEVAAVQVDVVNTLPGLLVAVPGRPQGFALLDEVRAGELVARLDDRSLQAQLKVFQVDVARLKAEVDAIEAQVRQRDKYEQYTQLFDARRLAVEVEQLRLAAMDRTTQREVARIQLADAEANFKATETLVKQGLAPALTLEDLKAKRDRAAQLLADQDKAITEVVKQQQAALAAVGKYTPAELADVDKFLAPARAALTTQQARIDEVCQQIALLELKAPVSGTIVAINRRPGQPVAMHDVILSIAVKESRAVVAYVRQDVGVRPKLEMPVEVRLRGIVPTRSARLKIDKVGPQVMPVPPHQLRDPRVPEWGLPVSITITDLPVRPGELVDVALRPG